MATETRTTDAKGRLSLPKGFANSTVIMEQGRDSELRIRKARVVPKAEIVFREESLTLLSDRDRDRFLKLLENPPKANAALKRLVKRGVRHG